jgi:hypothetical protein
MYPHKEKLDLPELRRQLEELLALVTADSKTEGRNQSPHVHIVETGPTNNELSEFARGSHQSGMRAKRR